MTAAPPLIEARRVSMSLPGVRALSEVDFLPARNITHESAVPR